MCHGDWITAGNSMDTVNTVNIPSNADLLFFYWGGASASGPTWLFK